MAGIHVREDDVCDYFIFPPVPESLTEIEVKRHLEEHLDKYLAYLSSYLVNYIWQNEPFRLRIVPGTDTSPPHLYGCTNYGDNVEDEWFIVHLLYSITKHFEGVIARIFDADGEFLLIEAADDLPRWVNPETAENRVLICNGLLHIIPIPKSPAEVVIFPAGTPSLLQAVTCIRNANNQTLASEKIQRAIQRKIRSYPQKAEQSFHRAHCYVPAALAVVLKHSPGLVAPAVQAFYHRDPTDLKACRTMTHFRPGTRIMTEVKFTKCLYAQLMKQKFQPERRSDWTIPPANSPKFKAYDLGMKLAFGFEILCAQCSSNQNPEPGVPARPVSLVRWRRYLEALKQRGYFRGELEGSKLYQELQESAKKYFNKAISTNNGFFDEPGKQIMRVLKDTKYDLEEMRKNEKLLSPPDDDSWLDLTPEQLDDMLNTISDQDKKPEKPFDLSDVSDSMKDFVEKVSTHEGAEFPKDEDGESIQFDAGGFIQSMQQIFDFEDPESSDSSDMSEYGSDSDDDELGTVRHEKQKKAQKKAANKMHQYMNQMDRELAKTNVGKSFERTEKKDQEKKTNGTAPSALLDSDDEDDIDDLDDDFKPVNVDMTVVKNMLQSYTSQHGDAGPASNILESMGVKVPRANAEN